MRIHIIGAGKMGLPMAQHLQAGGHQLTVADRNEERRAAARAAGLEVESELFVLGESDVILSSLPDDAALLSVGQQVAQHASRGTIYVDTSTVSPAASEHVAQACAESSVPYLRVAVSGNNKMAEAAQLTLMASGPRPAYEAVLPVLKLLGPTQFYLGDGEQARLMKLVINLMIAQTSAMLAEALALGRKGGLAWDDLWAVIGASAVASPILKSKAQQLVRRDFKPTFTVTQMIKDLGLILDAAAAQRVPLPQTALTLQLMQSAVACGDGDADYAAIIKAAERAAGMETQL